VQWRVAGWSGSGVLLVWRVASVLPTEQQKKKIERKKRERQTGIKSSKRAKYFDGGAKPTKKQSKTLGSHHLNQSAPLRVAGGGGTMQRR
jgi:hypothetical protein